MSFDSVTPQERILLTILKEANSWTPLPDLINRYKKKVGIGKSRTVGVTALINRLLPKLEAKAYAKRETRGTIEGWTTTPRGWAFLES